MHYARARRKIGVRRAAVLPWLLLLLLQLRLGYGRSSCPPRCEPSRTKKFNVRWKARWWGWRKEIFVLRGSRGKGTSGEVGTMLLLLLWLG